MPVLIMNKPAYGTAYIYDEEYELYDEIMRRIKGPTHMRDLIKQIKVIRHFRPELVPDTYDGVESYIFHFIMDMYRRKYIIKVAKYTFDLPSLPEEK